VSHIYIGDRQLDPDDEPDDELTNDDIASHDLDDFYNDPGEPNEDPE